LSLSHVENVRIVLDKAPAEVEAATKDQTWMEGVTVLRPVVEAEK